MSYYETLIRAIYDNTSGLEKDRIKRAHTKFFDPKKQEMIDNLTEREWQKLKREYSQGKE